MKYLPIFYFIILLLTSCRQSEDKQLNNDSQFTIGQRDSVYSSLLNESRSLMIYHPPSLDTTLRYPVIYVLDGPSHFHSFTGMVEFLSKAYVIPKAIVVAIGNTKRMRDLTPTYMATDLWKGEPLPETGGGDKFLDFMNQELFPHIEKKYHATQHRTLIGHSLGGLLTIHALIKRPELFTSYISIDPSLWWDNQHLLKEVDSVLKSQNYSGKSLFLGAANHGGKDAKIQDMITNTSNYTLMSRSILEFTQYVEAHKSNGLRFEWRYYPNDEHYSSAFPTQYDGLRFTFNWHHLIFPQEFIMEPATSEGAIALEELVTSHYKQISQHLGNEVLPYEQLMDSRGYQFQFEEKWAYAYVLLSMNIKNYPQSALAHEKMGDYYIAMFDTTKAIEFYTKAIGLNKNQQSTNLIERIKELKKGR